MILDNADDSAVFDELREERTATGASRLSRGTAGLSSFLPHTGNGSILMTSRDMDLAIRLVGDATKVIMVEPMDNGHALTLLEKKLIRPFNQDDAAELLHLLEYLPLAITQAASYINNCEPLLTIHEYLSLFRQTKGPENLLRNYPDPIITTWQI